MIRRDTGGRNPRHMDHGVDLPSDVSAAQRAHYLTVIITVANHRMHALDRAKRLIEADDGVTRRQQCSHRLATDFPGTTCYCYPHYQQSLSIRPATSFSM